MTPFNSEFRGCAHAFATGDKTTEFESLNMAKAGGAKCILHVLNVLYVILGLALAAGSLWFFVQVYEFTSLRNANHYLLDYNLYWPQAIPWMFCFVALFAVAVAGLGFAAVKKRSRRLMVIYVIFQVVVTVLLIVAAIIALIFADAKATDDFIKDTVWDAYFQAKENRAIETSFSTIERKLQCCGAESPRDYKNWKGEFPRSCCDTYYHGFYDSYILECDFSNKAPNERYGCSAVATQYARITIKVLAAFALFIAFLGLISIGYAISYSRVSKQKPRVIQHPNETESHKVLL